MFLPNSARDNSVPVASCEESLAVELQGHTEELKGDGPEISELWQRWRLYQSPGEFGIVSTYPWEVEMDLVARGIIPEAWFPRRFSDEVPDVYNGGHRAPLDQGCSRGSRRGRGRENGDLRDGIPVPCSPTLAI